MDIQLPRNKYAFPNFYLTNKRSKPTSTLIKLLFFLKPKLPSLLETKTQRSQIYINSSFPQFSQHANKKKTPLLFFFGGGGRWLKDKIGIFYLLVILVCFTITEEKSKLTNLYIYIVIYNLSFQATLFSIYIYIYILSSTICSLFIIAFHDCISDYLMKTNVFFFLPQLFYSAISYLGSHRNQ